ncbi:MAG: biotin/lipoyl-binding protein [Planctomycetota bacterium]
MNLFQRVVETLLFYHPAVWWVSGRMRAERELCCDQWAVRLTGRRTEYAQALVELARTQQTVVSPAFTAGMFGTKLTMLERVRRVLQLPQPPRQSRFWLAGPLSLVIAGAMILAAHLYGSDSQAQAAADQTKANKPAEVNESPIKDAHAKKTEDRASTKGADVEWLTTTVKVVDEDGKPVEGAMITPTGLRTRKSPAGHYGWAYRFGEPDPSRTDADGIARVDYPEYVLEKMHTGTITFNVDHPEFCRAGVEHKLDEKHEPVTLIKGIMLKVSSYLGSKKNVLDNIYPQVGNYTYVGDDWHDAGNGVLVNKRIPAGLHYLRLVHFPEKGETYFSEPITFYSKKGKSYFFPNNELKPGARLEGKISDTVPRPVRNGRVVVLARPAYPQEDAGLLQWKAWTDIAEDGTFVFKSLPLGKVECVALCDGFVSRNPTEYSDYYFRVPQVFPFHKSGTRVELEMEPSATCEVKLQDEQGNPIEGARVHFWPNVEWRNGHRQVFAQRRYTTETYLRNGGKYSCATKAEAMKDHDFQSFSDARGIAVVRNLPARIGRKSSFSVDHDVYEVPARIMFGHHGDRSVSIELTSGKTTKATVTMHKKGTEFLGAEEDEKLKKAYLASRVVSKDKEDSEKAASAIEIDPLLGTPGDRGMMINGRPVGVQVALADNTAVTSKPSETKEILPKTSIIETDFGKVEKYKKELDEQRAILEPTVQVAKAFYAFRDAIYDRDIEDLKKLFKPKGKSPSELDIKQLFADVKVLGIDEKRYEPWKVTDVRIVAQKAPPRFPASSKSDYVHKGTLVQCDPVFFRNIHGEDWGIVPAAKLSCSPNNGGWYVRKLTILPFKMSDEPVNRVEEKICGQFYTDATKDSITNEFMIRHVSFDRGHPSSFRIMTVKLPSDSEGIKGNGGAKRRSKVIYGGIKVDESQTIGSGRFLDPLKKLQCFEVEPMPSPLGRIISSQSPRRGRTSRYRSYVPSAPIIRTVIHSMADGLVAEVKVKQGQKVKKGDLLVKLDNSEILFDLEAAEVDLESAQNRYNVYVETVGLEQKLTGKEKEAAVERYLDALSANPESDVKGALKRAQLEVKRCKLRLERTRIDSPIDGMVESVAVGLSRGKKVSAGDELLWIQSEEKAPSSQPAGFRSRRGDLRPG